MDTPIPTIRPADQHQTRLGMARLFINSLAEESIYPDGLQLRQEALPCVLHTVKHCTTISVTEPQLLHFVAFLVRSSFSYQSYLSAVRHLLIVSGYPDPSLSSLPCLSYALKGIQRDRPTGQRRTRLLITPELLTGIFWRWSAEPVTFDRVMLWAAFCLGLCVQGSLPAHASLHSFSPDMLTPGDVAVDSHVSPSYITVHLKHSKNDPLGAGTTIHLGATGASLCPVLQCWLIWLVVPANQAHSSCPGMDCPCHDPNSSGGCGKLSML